MAMARARDLISARWHIVISVSVSWSSENASACVGVIIGGSVPVRKGGRKVTPVPCTLVFHRFIFKTLTSLLLTTFRSRFIIGIPQSGAPVG
jgi:hypothetical protein